MSRAVAPLSRWWTVATVAVGVAIAAACALGSVQIVRAVGGSIGWAVIEYAIVFVVALLAQSVGVFKFGRWLRNKDRLERLAARNVRIRAGAGYEPSELV